MDWNSLKQIVQEAFADSYENAGGQEFRYIHSCNVAGIAKEIAEKLDKTESDIDLVVTAALFHDIGKAERISASGFLDGSHQTEAEQNMIPHEQISAQYVRTKLDAYLTAEQKEAVAKIIENHDAPTEELEKILHDADELSEMGAMNVWKMTTYSAYKKRDLIKTIDYWFAEDKARHQEKTANLFLEVSKEMGNHRIGLVDEYFANLKHQII